MVEISKLLLLLLLANPTNRKMVLCCIDAKKSSSLISLAPQWLNKPSNIKDERHVYISIYHQYSPNPLFIYNADPKCLDCSIVVPDFHWLMQWSLSLA